MSAALRYFEKLSQYADWVKEAAPSGEGRQRSWTRPLGAGIDRLRARYPASVAGYQGRVSNQANTATNRQHGSSARAQTARNETRARSGNVAGQSYEDWSKGREGWTEDARRRRYARSAEGMAWGAMGND